MIPKWRSNSLQLACQVMDLMTAASGARRVRLARTGDLDPARAHVGQGLLAAAPGTGAHVPLPYTPQELALCCPAGPQRKHSARACIDVRSGADPKAPPPRKPRPMRSTARGPDRIGAPHPRPRRVLRLSEHSRSRSSRSGPEQCRPRAGSRLRRGAIRPLPEVFVAGVAQARGGQCCTVQGSRMPTNAAFPCVTGALGSDCLGG